MAWALLGKRSLAGLSGLARRDGQAKPRHGGEQVPETVPFLPERKKERGAAGAHGEYRHCPGLETGRC